MLNTSTTPTVPTGYPKLITQTIQFNVSSQEDEDFVRGTATGGDYFMEVDLFLTDIGCELVTINIVV